jgi:hypothetical protein
LEHVNAPLNPEIFRLGHGALGTHNSKNKDERVLIGMLGGYKLRLTRDATKTSSDTVPYRSVVRSMGV